MDQIKTQLETLESNLDKKFEQHSNEIKSNGEAHAETKNEIKNLMDQYKDLSAKLETFETKSNRLGGNADAPVNFKSAFASEIKDMNLQERFKEYGKAEFELKGVSLSGETHPATTMPGVVMSPERAVRIRQLMSTSNADSDRIYFNEETAVVDRTTMRSAGGDTSTSGLTTETTVVQKAADVKGISNIMSINEVALADVAFMSSYVPTKLERLYLDKEDQQILYGSGAGDEIEGLFTNPTAYDSTGIISGATMVDQLRWAAKQVRTGEYRATAFMLNPEDYALLEMQKTTDGAYLFPGIFTGQIPTISGVPVFEHSEVEVGHFGVADLQRATTLFLRQGMTIKMYDGHDANLKSGQVAFKITGRLALTNERPAAVVYGEF